jgi:plastocyanin
MNKAQLVGLALASAALMLATIAPSAGALAPVVPKAVAADPVDVTILAFTFIPPVALETDGSVTFTNSDIVAHHPHSHADPADLPINHPAADGCFDAGTLNPGASVTVPIACAKYLVAYHCDIHPFMRGYLVQYGYQAK